MAKGRLLLVDDEPLILKMLEINLAPYADQILTAENGKVALETFKENEIHCVVCDINMPIMNGVEFIKKVRELGSQVPFIFFTAYNERELMLRALKFGAFDFLTKPNFDGLEEVVAKGLKEGFKLPTLQDDEKLLSEYQKLLLGIDS